MKAIHNNKAMSIPNGYGPAGYAAQRLVLLALAWAMALAAFPAWAQALPTLTVDYEPVARERHFDGLVEAERRSTVSAQVSARIEDLPFDVDDYVERGDVIVRFRDQQVAADLKQAEAASLEARARLEESRSNYDRIARLFEQQRVSQADMDRATADQQSARARVEAAEGALLSAQENYENTLVRAPFAGIVVERHVELGEMATVGTPLMTGLSLEHLRVVADVPQHDIGALRDGGEAFVDLPDGGSLGAEAIRELRIRDAEASAEDEVRSKQLVAEEAQLSDLLLELSGLRASAGDAGVALERDTAAAARLETVVERLRRYALVARERRAAIEGRIEGAGERRGDLTAERGELVREVAEAAITELRLAGDVERRTAALEALEDEERTIAEQVQLPADGQQSRLRFAPGELVRLRQQDMGGTAGLAGQVQHLPIAL